MQTLLIYTPRATQRVKYIFQLFFDSLLPTTYTVTSDEASFKAYEGPRLNYSATFFEGVKLQIIPGGLLAETGINNQPIKVEEWNRLKIFYTTNQGILPFDIFSASFYLVSRYEEYFSHRPDNHMRFKYTNSLAYKNHFLDEPLVNLWAEELKRVIIAEYPSILFSLLQYSFVPTMDIDVAYAHLGRNIFVATGAYLKTLSRFDIKTAIEKKLVLMHLKKDPYDTFDYQETVFAKYKLRPIYFFLAACKRSDKDKNISPDNTRFKRLVKRVSTFAEIGIHPSYQSNSAPEIVAREIEKVQQNASQKVTCSRQHFLRLNLPETYRCLAKLGITDDYTLAYAGAVGFRASICTPFFFYDLQAESILPVKVHSTAVMDGTLNEYLRLSTVDAIVTSKDIIHKIKSVNGEFVAIWHNHSISEHGHWKGWRTVFETMMEEAN